MSIKKHINYRSTVPATLFFSILSYCVSILSHRACIMVYHVNRFVSFHYQVNFISMLQVVQYAIYDNLQRSNVQFFPPLIGPAIFRVI